MEYKNEELNSIFEEYFDNDKSHDSSYNEYWDYQQHTDID